MSLFKLRENGTTVGTGIRVGVVTSPAMSYVTGCGREVRWLAYRFSALLITRYAYVGG